MIDLAWVIEHTGRTEGPWYFAALAQDRLGDVWTRDHLRAIRFTREQDATAMLMGLPKGLHLIGKVVEHSWSRALYQEPG